MPEYRGEELDAARGPGLGCFWLQVVLLAALIILTPLTVKLGWPPIASAVLLFVTLGLLLFVGQTVIFLLRIVAAERRGRRRPVAARTRTVGEIEDAVAGAGGAADGSPLAASPDATPADGSADHATPAASPGATPAASPGANPAAVPHRPDAAATPAAEGPDRADAVRQ